MKSLFSILFASTCLFGETVTVQPQGDYATIDVQKDKALLTTLRDKKTPYEERKKIAQEIQNNPGDHIPIALLEAAPYFLDGKEYDKAAALATGGFHRVGIDAQIAQDPSLYSLAPQLLATLGEYAAKQCAKEMDHWTDALIKAQLNFESWDKATPRNYDERWICLHSPKALYSTTLPAKSDKEKKKIREEFYKQIREPR